MIASLFALLPLLALTSASPITKRESNRLIESGRNSGFCLSVQGGRAAVAAGQIGNDTPVVTLACGAASYWDISKGSGSVIVSGTSYALDIGLTPGNHGGVKIYQSYPTAGQQTWYLTDDNRIAITGGDQCLDLGVDRTQTFQCTTGNNNQVWNVRFGDVGPSSSVAPSASSSLSIIPAPSGTMPPGFLSQVPVSSGAKDTPGGGQRIRVIGREDLCVMVASGYAAIGTNVGICNNGTFSNLQEWDIPSVGSTGQIKLHNNPGLDLCLDAGSTPSNGVGAKIWTCGDYPQQQWTNTGGTLKTINNQCLDIEKDSQPTQSKPYGLSLNIQTWECSTNGDPYMGFRTA